MNISQTERDLQIAAIVKSNLVGFGFESDVIDKITKQITIDMIDLLEAYDLANELTAEEFKRIMKEDYVDVD
jgi:hypothetical protein